ncbi:Protein N-acetyltransferase, RimJ/RimL family [Propionibacterium cyclohexanicum]|mgnify:CR=1 FL=1|uniref:Protein N-acetyltransferase, RimJ/RimL family n=2 Tax=Propionibacterium cyclohexanicum TaxID=64702 RepID=A0A1H9RX67_9ACTN|nr:Protein N-acetyltransferase, RimJ/RimL family [Propionibacterium cyclohexanicum]
MARILADPALYAYIDDTPLDEEQLAARYESQTSRWDSATTKWRNWVVRLKPAQCAIGYVQATIEPHECILAWVINPQWQGNGYATEAALGVIEQTYAQLGITRFSSTIDRRNAPSRGVAQHLGMAIAAERCGTEDYWTMDME